MNRAPAPGRADVAFVIEDLACGGAQRVAAHLIEAWAAQGKAVRLITMRPSEEDFFIVPPSVSRDVIGHVGVSRDPLTAVRANISRARALRRAIVESGAPAVVSFVNSTNVLVIIATRGLGLRVVVSERNDPGRQPIGRTWRVLRRATYRLADVVTANSVNGVEALTGFVPRTRLALLPNPVVLPPALADVAHMATVLTVSRLVAHKRHALVIDAFGASVTATGDALHEWRLAVVGDGPERTRLASHIANRGLDTRVRLEGQQPDPTTFYRHAGIYVLASAYEGTSNALLEAMAHGLPCVVPDDVPGALSLVEDGVTGRTFHGNDARHLAAVLTSLMTDPLARARLGEAARARVADRSVSRVVNDLDALLQSASPRVDGAAP